MEDRFEISLLMDHYGDLLTEKQQRIMNLYFDEDFSLSEIAELNGSSRQAVLDLIKRVHGTLRGYEARLGLQRQSEELEAKKLRIIQRLEELGQTDETLIDLIRDL